MSIAIVFAIAAAFVWSLLTVVDKVIVSRFVREPFLLVMVSSVASLFVGGAMVLFGVQDGISGRDLVIALVAGAGYNLMTLTYFWSLAREESSRVAPLFALTAPLVAIGSALFLSELFSITTYAGIALIFIGSVLLLTRHRLLDIFRSSAAGFMVLSVAIGAITVLFEKSLLERYNFWTVFGYFQLAAGMFVPLLIAFSWRRLRRTLAAGKVAGLAGSLVAFILDAGATALYFVALSRWYATGVAAVETVEYVFLFVWTVLLSRFAPGVLREALDRRTVLLKVVAIVLIVVGILFVPE